MMSGPWLDSHFLHKFMVVETDLMKKKKALLVHKLGFIDCFGYSAEKLFVLVS